MTLDVFVGAFVLAMIGGLLMVRLARQIWEWVFQWIPF
jgi:hypothetical protein